MVCRKDNILCYKNRFYKSTYSCRICMNLEFYREDNENILLFDPSNKYPTDCDNLYDNKLQPQILTSELLQKVCKTTHYKILEGYWSSSDGDAYLKVHGLDHN